MRLLLEVIVQSVADAVEAAVGGADRLEVVRDIRGGGFTPPASLVRAIGKATSLPLRVMVREGLSDGSNPGDLGGLRQSAAELQTLGIDGLVMGFLRDGQPDVEALRSVLEGAASARVTFHRAFDAVGDPLHAIDLLTDVPQVDRILTSAGEHDPAVIRCERLHRYAERAGSRLEIIAGGGLDERTLAVIAQTGCVREAHIGRAAREANQPEGPVSAVRVRRLREIAG